MMLVSANLPCMALILFFHLLRNLLSAFLLKHLLGTVLSKYCNYKQMYTAPFLKEPIVQLRDRLSVNIRKIMVI